MTPNTHFDKPLAAYARSRDVQQKISEIWGKGPIELVSGRILISLETGGGGNLRAGAFDSRVRKIAIFKGAG